MTIHIYTQESNREVENSSAHGPSEIESSSGPEDQIVMSYPLHHCHRKEKVHNKQILPLTQKYQHNKLLTDSVYMIVLFCDNRT